MALAMAAGVAAAPARPGAAPTASGAARPAAAASGGVSPIETKHLTVTVAPVEAAPPGARVSLALDVTPRTGMHVYAPQQKDYIPISLTLRPLPGVRASAPRFPRPESVRIEALDETQQVYSRPFRIVQEITLPSGARAGSEVTITGTLRYQACDNTICYLPVSVPVAWTIALKRAAQVTP